MQYQIKATKTSLYNLCKRHWPDIAPMRRTTFKKAYRCRSYWLDFNSAAMYHHVFFSCCGGDAMLGDAWEIEEEDGTKTEGWETHKIGMDELSGFGLIKEVPEKSRADI